MSHLALPFGWLASPSFYQLFAESATLHRANLAPINPEWNGSDTFRKFTFVDDSMSTESWIGNRNEPNVACWEFCAKRTAGDSSVI